MLPCIIDNFYRNVYTPIGQFIDLTFNYILLAGAITGVLIFFLQFNKSIKLQKQVLGPLGISTFQCLRVLFICFKRHKTAKRIQVFVETSILHGKGVCHNRKWWRKECSHFSRNLHTYGRFADNDPLKWEDAVEIANCFDLTSEDFSNVIQSYFEAVKRIWPPADRNTAEPQTFLTPVRIMDGYLAPMSFISGLAKRFDQDWKKILDNYYATLETAEDEDIGDDQRILASELYFSYNWLMWGPSYRVPLNSDPSVRQLILYGYGDEANSVNVVVRGEDKTTLARQFKRFGFHSSIRGTLVDTHGYTDYYRHGIDDDGMPFFTRLSNPSLNIPFALDMHSIVNSQNSPNYFFSAYIWIMFILERDGYENTFSPERSVTFFEHANLPNDDNYNFLIECLLNKVFSYFEQFASLPAADKARERRYRFCISMNDEIKMLFAARLREKVSAGDETSAWFANNLVYDPDGSFNIATILNAFDNYFMQLKIREMKYSSDSDRRKLGEFYAHTYFPTCGGHPRSQPLHDVLRKLQASEGRDAGDYKYHVLSALDENGNIAGVVAFYYIKCADGHNGAVIEDLVAKNGDKRIRERLMQEARDCIKQDANWDRRSSADYILFRAMAYCDDERARARTAAMWEEDGFIPLSGSMDNIWLIYLRDNNTGGISSFLDVANRYGEHQQFLHGSLKSGRPEGV